MKFLERATETVNKISKKSKGNKLKDFKETLQSELNSSEVSQLGKDINSFALQFPVLFLKSCKELFLSHQYNKILH